MFWNRVLQGAISASEGSTAPPTIAEVEFGATPAIVVASETLEEPVSIVVLRSGSLAPECSVTWALTGTATAADYVVGQALTGIVLFPTTVNMAVISLALRPALAGTPDKSIIVTLSNPINCEISGASFQSIHVDMPGLAEPSDEYDIPLRTLRVTNRTELLAVLTQTTGTFPTSVVIVGSNRNAPLRALDRVIVADGDYTGDYTPAAVTGTVPANPIVIYSENLHGARFLGRLTLNRQKMWAARLDFDGEGLETSAGLTISGAFCRAHRCRFRRVESSSTEQGRIIVNVAAPDAQLYYCGWDDNDARLVSGRAQDIARLHMYRCYLSNSRPETSTTTTREGVQIGQTQAGGDGLPGSLSPVHTVTSALVEFCLFENMLQLGGEANEVVSIKSSGNTVRQCTFVDCQYLTVRFGNDNRVESNWFQVVGGTKNRGIGVRGDRNVIIGNRLGAGTAIRVYSGNMDMTCAGWDKASAGNFGTPRYMNPRVTAPTWGVAYSRPWSHTTAFDAAGNVSAAGLVDPDLPIARENWLIANDGQLEIGHDGSDIHNAWRAWRNHVRLHVGAIKTEVAYPSWANVPTPTESFFESLTDYNSAIDARYLPLPAPAVRLTSGEVGPSAAWIPPPGTIVPPPDQEWFNLPDRSALPWGHGVAYWYDRTVATTPTGWPYPQSTAYARLNFTGALTRYANGGDQWMVTDDGTRLLFAAADDGGWAGPGQSGGATKSSVRVIRVTGTPPSGLSGTNLAFKPFDEHHKPQAIVAMTANDIALYFSYELASPVDAGGRTYCAISSNGGTSFTWNDGTGDDIFAVGSGDDLMVWGALDGGAVDDDYIYLYMGRMQQSTISFYAAGSGMKNIYLARVKWKGTGGSIPNLLNRAKYSLFQGMSGGLPTWGADGGSTGEAAVFTDTNGMACGFNVNWHTSISKYVATYIHAGIGSGTQGIAVAISDSPWDPDGWQMIGYGRDLENAASDETDWYLSAQAPSRWNNGSTMNFGVSTYVEGTFGGTGDNLIVTSVALSPSVSGVTSAADYAAEEADLAKIDAATGSSKGDGGGDQTNIADWDGVIGGAIGSAMDTSDTQFDWTSSDLRYAFDDVVAKLPTGGAFATDGSGWLIWDAVLIPVTLSTAVEANFAVWDQIVAGTHDLKYKKFGERVVRRMALTGHPLKRLIISVNPEMNRPGTYRVWPSTRDKYKAAMIRAINLIRQGAGEYQAGAGDEFHFLHSPSHVGDIGSLASYCPDNVDCVGLSWLPGSTVTNDAQLTALLDGTTADTYGVRTDLIVLADALGGLPLCFPRWAPKNEALDANPIADLVVQRFYDFLKTISHRLVADCVFDQTIRSLTGFAGTSSAGDAAWRRMVPLRKRLYRGEPEPPTPGTGGPIRRAPHDKHYIFVHSPLSGALAPFSAISNLTYRAVYYNNASMMQAVYGSDTLNDPVTSDVLDHGTAGMVAHGRAYVRRLIKNKGSGAPNLMWFDPEELAVGVHRNVPQSVINDGWTQTHKARGYICTYDINLYPSWRAEAIRWHKGVMTAAYQIAREEGLTNFEICHYNIPSKTSYPGTASFTTQASELKTSLFSELLSFGGPGMYFSGGGTGDYLSLPQMITWGTNIVSRIRTAFGANHRIVPTIWPRWYPSKDLVVPGGSVFEPSDYKAKPSIGIAGGTSIIPAGWFYDWCDALLDAGADGFMCWKSSGDDSHGITGQWQDRWDECVQVIQDRGTFRRPT